jgi:hypothetical protein
MDCFRKHFDVDGMSGVFNVNHVQAATHTTKAAALTYNECASYKKHKVKQFTACSKAIYRHGENSRYRFSRPPH